MSKITLKNSREYTAFFEENEHGGYTITVPALPGLVTEAKDMKQAKVVLQDAITCYIEGLKKAKVEIPKESFVASMRLSFAV
jgi:predicted RNase H-like HicB family nuclease